MVRKADYKKDLKAAEQELAKLLEQRDALDKRIAKLRQEIGSLAHLSGTKEPNSVFQLLATAKNQLGLKASCLEVLRAYDEPLTPTQVVEGIARLGLHPGNHINLLASVHTTLRRMAENGEAEESGKEGKKAYKLGVNRPTHGAK